MSVNIKECTSCPTPKKQVFHGQVVVEDEFNLVPGIPRPEKVKLEPLFETFKVELACSNLVVVCGILRKIIILPECECRKPIIHDFAFQANIPVSIETSVPLSLCDLKVTGVEVCDGCFKLLDPTRVRCNTIFHKIKEKDILRIEVTYTLPEYCMEDHHKDHNEYEEHEDYDQHNYDDGKEKIWDKITKVYNYEED